MTLERVEGDEIERWVAAAAAGDVAAFDRLVRRYQHEVFTLAKRLVTDPDLAADVAQEAFIRAWRGLPRFRGDAAFSTWLHRITVNTAWTLRARRRRRATVAMPEGLDVVDVDDRTDPELAGERVGMRHDLLAALAGLRPGLRTVVVLKDVYGWTHREIADQLGISETACKVRLHRARAALRRALERRGGP